MKYILLLYFLFPTTLCLKLRAQDKNFVELKTFDSNEFNKLKPFLEDALIIGMGESTHGTHEFFISRIQLFQYLVNNLGYNTFFLEADYANCLPINNFINGGAGDANELVQGITLWPWMTLEMVELVNWMKNYNKDHPNNRLSFIGVDVQKINETVAELIRVLDLNSPKSLLSLKEISNSEFYNLKKGDIKQTFQPAIIDLQALDITMIEAQDTSELKLLLRYFNQIIDTQLSKNSAYRDIQMGENIIFHLQKDKDTKGFFWAHNIHIANWYNQKKQSGVAGGVLRHHLKDKYFSIGQEFYQGSFNVYYKPESDGEEEVEEYTLGSVTVGPAAEGSLAANFYDSYTLPLFIPFKDLPDSEEVIISNIGARYIINDNPKSIWRYNHHGKDAFDAILLIETSTPTKLISD